MQPNSRVRRRKTRRNDIQNGAVQLQFVTATNPAQFRDENTRRSVRSQAMIHYRKSKSEEKKHGAESTADSTGSPNHDEQLTEDQDPVLFNSRTAQRTQTIADHASERNTHSMLQSTSSRSSPTHLMRFIQSASKADARVVNYELSTSHEEALCRMLVVQLATFHQIGDGVDPFNVIPQYENPELSAVWLQRNCKYCCW